MEIPYQDQREQFEKTFALFLDNIYEEFDLIDDDIALVCIEVLKKRLTTTVDFEAEFEIEDDEDDEDDYE